MHSSPVINQLLEFLGEEPSGGQPSNHTTLLRQGQFAQDWLLQKYLGAWLTLIGGLVDCDYPIARRHRVQFRALSHQVELLSPAEDVAMKEFHLQALHDLLRATLRSMRIGPDERGMQWGIWARDVPMSIAEGFAETEFLDPFISQNIAPCCMYAALLVSEVVTDYGVAEEIAGQMFEEMPRQLVGLLRELPEAPEA